MKVLQLREPVKLDFFNIPSRVKEIIVTSPESFQKLVRLPHKNNLFTKLKKVPNDNSSCRLINLNSNIV